MHSHRSFCKLLWMKAYLTHSFLSQFLLISIIVINIDWDYWDAGKGVSFSYSSPPHLIFLYSFFLYCSRVDALNGNPIIIIVIIIDYCLLYIVVELMLLMDILLLLLFWFTVVPLLPPDVLMYSCLLVAVLIWSWAPLKQRSRSQ